jgi:hypothetical protein
MHVSSDQADVIDCRHVPLDLRRGVRPSRMIEDVKGNMIGFASGESDVPHSCAFVPQRSPTIR